MNQGRNNIILVGMPGSGKSTIGRLLSEKTGYDFVDMDVHIERKCNRSISEIFKTDGEQFFRELETKTLLEFLDSSNFSGCILSTGGGTVENKDNMDILKKLGKVFYLQVSPEMIFDRIKEDKNRPLLQKENPLQILKELYNKRENNYNLADYVIDASKNAETVTEYLYEKING